MKISLKTETKPVFPLEGEIIFDNKDIVRLVRREAQRVAGVAEADIRDDIGGVTLVSTGELLAIGDFVKVEFWNK